MVVKMLRLDACNTGVKMVMVERENGKGKFEKLFKEKEIVKGMRDSKKLFFFLLSKSYGCMPCLRNITIASLIIIFRVTEKGIRQVELEKKNCKLKVFSI